MCSVRVCSVQCAVCGGGDAVPTTKGTVGEGVGSRREGGLEKGGRRLGCKRGEREAARLTLHHNSHDNTSTPHRHHHHLYTQVYGADKALPYTAPSPNVRIACPLALVREAAAASLHA